MKGANGALKRSKQKRRRIRKIVLRKILSNSSNDHSDFHHASATNTQKNRNTEIVPWTELQSILKNEAKEETMDLTDVLRSY
jgi:protein tyrosine phosphatase